MMKQLHMFFRYFLNRISFGIQFHMHLYTNFKILKKPDLYVHYTVILLNIMFPKDNDFKSYYVQYWKNFKKLIKMNELNY